MDSLLIWDFDGTLAYRPGLWSGSIMAVLDAYHPNHGVHIETVRPSLQTGFRWHEPQKAYPQSSPEDWWAELHPIFEDAFLKVGLSAAQAKALAPKIKDQYLDPDSWEVYSDTVPTLQTLSAAGWKHVILTNHVPEFRGLLTALGLDKYFEAVFNSAETGFEKPHPEAFQTVLTAYPNARRVCMIGDNPAADVGGAEATGIPAILVRKAGATRWNCVDLSGIPALLGAILLQSHLPRCGHPDAPEGFFCPLTARQPNPHCGHGALRKGPRVVRRRWRKRARWPSGRQ